MRAGIPRFAWVLAGVLLLSIGLLFLGNRQGITSPDSNSYAPSGTRAFRAIAEELGYRTRSANVLLGELPKDEIIVAFFVQTKVDPKSIEWQKRNRVNQTLYRHLENGGSVLFVTLPRDFRSASKTAFATPTQLNGPGGSLKAAVVENPDSYISFEESSYTLLLNAEERVVWVSKVGKGRAVFADGLVGLTNRFIDRDDNAAVAALCLAAAGSGKKLTFYEASHNGAGDPSVVEMLGPWAVGAWWQLNLAFVILVLTLGVRFGLPHQPRQIQGGGRDLADALADTLARSNKYMVAFRAIVKESDRLLRRRLKIASDVPTEVRDRMLPESLAQVLSIAERACNLNPPREEALSMIRRLDLEVSRYLGEGVRRSAGRRKR